MNETAQEHGPTSVAVLVQGAPQGWRQGSRHVKDHVEGEVKQRAAMHTHTHERMHAYAHARANAHKHMLVRACVFCVRETDWERECGESGPFATCLWVGGWAWVADGRGWASG